MSALPYPGAAPARFAQVALPLPLASPYTYRIPDELSGRIAPGSRVLVPVRRRELVGVVVALRARAPSVRLRDVIARLDAEPTLSPELLTVARWMSAYYGAPLGLALKVMLPGGMWGTDGPAQEQHERVVLLPEERPTLVERDVLFKRRARQRG